MREAEDTVKVVKVLLEHHAKTDPRDIVQKTVLGEALTTEPRPTKVIELLQKYGAKE